MFSSNFFLASPSCPSPLFSTYVFANEIDIANGTLYHNVTFEKQVHE